MALDHQNQLVHAVIGATFRWKMFSVPVGVFTLMVFLQVKGSAHEHVAMLQDMQSLVLLAASNNGFCARGNG